MKWRQEKGPLSKFIRCTDAKQLEVDAINSSISIGKRIEHD
jgi:hypothetical protein